MEDMNNLDKILQKIAADAEERCQKIDEDTRARLSAMEAETAKRIAAMEADAAVTRKKETDAILSRANAECAMRERETILAEKAALLDEVYARAEKAICALPAEKYGAFLAGLAADAIAERLDTVRRLREEYGEEEVGTEDTFVLLLSGSCKIRCRYLCRSCRHTAKIRCGSVRLTDHPLRYGRKNSGRRDRAVRRHGDLLFHSRASFRYPGGHGGKDRRNAVFLTTGTMLGKVCDRM